MNRYRPTLFDHTNIGTLPWPDTMQGLSAKKFLYPMILNGPNHYIDNIKTSMQALLFDNIVLPITINNHEDPFNSYVCSAFAHYVGYGKKEMQLVRNKPLRFILSNFLKAFGSVLKLGKVDRTVYVNNWLLSTNLYPPLNREHIHTITKFLIKSFPDHIIAFRSINPLKPSGLYEHLKSEGFDFVISRMIYHTDTNSPSPFRSRMFKSDLSVLSQSAYASSKDKQLTEPEISRVCELYRKLNIEKHSTLNPQFNTNFIRLIIDNPAFTIETLKHNDRIDGVYAYFEQDNGMTSPFFGYDTSLSQTLGLYRQISTLLLLNAKEKGMWLHQSSGGGNFKSLRRASKSLEYTAIHYDHLPLARQMPWKILSRFLNPIIKRILYQSNP